ncbi:MAG: peptidase M61 [Sphingomonas adhaesiva]|uniref:peptidase M61 n=1 Tax=Sphingomonas adhaesiva TaxID=28212 RepID=UPI002FF9AE6E
MPGAALLLALAAPAAAPAVEIVLAPHAERGAIDRLTVTLRLRGVAAAAGAPVLRLPLVASNVDTVARTITTIAARDARGTVTLRPRDVDLPTAAARDAEAGGPSREWIADRAIAGPLTVRYAFPVASDLPVRGSGPPFAFRTDDGAVSGAGHVFLALPPGDAAYRTTIAWDLSALPKGARGVSSLGEGRRTAAEPLTAGQIRMGFFMAGRVATWPATPPATGFFSALQGRPPFDGIALMRWTGTLYGHYARFFRQKSPPPYGVFMRFNPINAGGGVGLYHSFVATYGRPGGPGSDPAELQFTLAHEMFHTFQPFIERPAGLESSWFGEGLATLYQRRLPLRFGMVSPASFLIDLNTHAGRYYTSAKATAPNRDIAPNFWRDTRLRTLPYDRGMLYFADLDDRLRKASGGRRSLDDLMFAMLALRGPTTNADWEALLRRDLGDRAVTDFRAFLDGAMPLPASDAFGPCFRRVARPLRRFEPGFDAAILATPSRIVTGVVPGSAAARAGLRDGDAIVTWTPQDYLQGEQTALMKLTIRRDDRVIPLEYLPRGETVDAWQWERVAGVPDTACAL